jgi:hypothetical protein
MDHPRGDRRVADLVDQDETAQIAIFGISLEGDWLIG